LLSLFDNLAFFFKCGLTWWFLLCRMASVTCLLPIGLTLFLVVLILLLQFLSSI
jgi:hypothetical protein